ncbi:MAG TPA: DUF4129 domain-containing protein [Mucilaginibacter sp.]|jgi:hypothetical protein|nr:DUF4129 domain-containing protein [Mucilaginibacter sp.]
MRRRFVSFYLIILFSLFCSVSFAGAKQRRGAKIVNDTSHVNIRSFNKDAIEKFKSDKDFDYSGTGAAYRETLWARFWNWLWRKIFSGIAGGGAALEYVMLGITTGLLVYFILKSAGVDASRLWRSESQKVDLEFTESLENIHAINFDAEIEKAVSQRDFRLAVRLLYLKCLKQLSDTKLISWQIDKTNSTYLLELKEASHKHTFGTLTRQFEYVWYGNFPIDQQAFGNIFNLFQDFKKQLP